jgi:hypothetical protein
LLFAASAIAGCRVAPPSIAPDAQAVESPPSTSDSPERAAVIPLRYHGRDLEMTVRRGEAVQLEPAGAGRPEKRMRIEKLTVTLDLTAMQWRSVFEHWFPTAAALPAGIDLHATPVVISGKSVWRYTCAAAPSPGRRESRFWRVYLIPDWRSALVICSEGWSPADQDRYREAMDEYAAEAAAKGVDFVW